MDKEEQNYIKSLTPKEKIAYEIAKDFLKSSFNMKKSLGFIEWKKANKSK